LREPCGSPPSSVLWARKTARLPVAAASGLPWVFRLIVTGRFGIVTDRFGNVTGDFGGT
jgi:hypothetical protein